MQRLLNDLELIAKKLKHDQWELVDDLQYHVGGPYSTEIIIVPKGFVTDMASTPFGIHNILPKDGSWSPASVIHDALYQNRGMLPVGWFSGPEMTYTQADCDGIFKEAMKVLGVSWWQRNLMWSALRLFGWISFKKNSPGRTPPEASQV